jgi:hypothetical protein
MLTVMDLRHTLQIADMQVKMASRRKRKRERPKAILATDNNAGTRIQPENRGNMGWNWPRGGGPNRNTHERYKAGSPGNFHRKAAGNQTNAHLKGHMGEILENKEPAQREDWPVVEALKRETANRAREDKQQLNLEELAK